MPVGIVDYCLIIGPSKVSLPSTIKKYFTSDHIIDSVKRDDDDVVNSSPVHPLIHLLSHPVTHSPALMVFDSELEMRNHALADDSVGSKSNDFCHDEGDEKEVAIWDKFPVHDHSHTPLPSKIEWFISPEGASFVHKNISTTHFLNSKLDAVDGTVSFNSLRPDHHFTSFVIQAGDEEQFGVCINFFLLVDFYRYPTGVVSSNKDVTDEITNNESDHEDSNIGTSSHIDATLTFCQVSLCFLTRGRDFLQPLAQCLYSLYSFEILPSIIQWEDKLYVDRDLDLERRKRTPFSSARDNLPLHLFMREDLCAAAREGVVRVDESESESKRSSNEAFPPSLYTHCRPLKISCRGLKYLSLLCLECPLPLPGLYDVALRMPFPPSSHQVLSTELKERIFPQTAFSSKPQLAFTYHDSDYISPCINFKAQSCTALQTVPLPRGGRGGTWDDQERNGCVGGVGSVCREVGNEGDGENRGNEIEPENSAVHSVGHINVLFSLPTAVSLQPGPHPIDVMFDYLGARGAIGM